MDFLYRVLGVVARMNERMSRFRVNFIPSNIGLMLVTGAVAFGSGLAAIMGVVEAGPPRTVRVADVLNHQGGRSYVRVTGVLHTDISLTETREGSGSVERTWVPLTDGSGKHGILVEVKEGSSDQKPGIVTLTGMLSTPSTALSEELSNKGNKIHGVEIDRETTLEEGGAPADPLLMAGVFLLSGAVAVMMLATLCMQYVVFRKTGAAPAPTGAAAWPENLVVRTTGRFVLDGQHSQRFLNVSSVLTELETGETALLANIDASSRFMGITTSKRAGIWAIILQPNSVKDVQLGLMYVGFAVLPALRFNFTDAADRRFANAIVTCESVTERDQVLRRLTQPAPTAPVAAPQPSHFDPSLPVASVLPETPTGSAPPGL